MNRIEIVECIYKHVGRSDDLENLIELAEEIARISAEEEREACAIIGGREAEKCRNMPDGQRVADAIRNR